ncbi:MAG: hypothetical protein R3E55_10335 [Burkholderiaceae bacterium]
MPYTTPHPGPGAGPPLGGCLAGAAAEHCTPQPGAQVLTELASALRADGDFARQPRLRGQCREAGCWTRADDAWLPVPDVWTRLAARVGPGPAAQAQGAQRLHAGACALGAGGHRLV